MKPNGLSPTARPTFKGPTTKTKHPTRKPVILPTRKDKDEPLHQTLSPTEEKI